MLYFPASACQSHTIYLQIILMDVYNNARVKDIGITHNKHPIWRHMWLGWGRGRDFLGASMWMWWHSEVCWGVYMFVNGSNHPYGCIKQWQSEGHWNNRPQTPNLTSYVTRINHKFWRETKTFDSYVWVSSTSFLCAIFLPVLVKAIPCIGKDMGMSTVAYASLMAELQQDGYTWKTREFQIFEGNQAIWFVRLGVIHYLALLYFPASACQIHPMNR